MEFNRIIKLLRKERGITQKQAAEDLGVSQALLSLSLIHIYPLHTDTADAGGKLSASNRSAPVRG